MAIFNADADITRRQGSDKHAMIKEFPLFGCRPGLPVERHCMYYRAAPTDIHEDSRPSLIWL